MPRVCSICTHPNRDALDREIVSGQPMGGIARRHAVGPDALQRHKVNHLSPAIRRVQAQRGGRLLNRVERLIERTEAILTAAEESGRVSVALQAVREMRELLRLLGNASGELDDKPSVTVNLMNTPAFTSAVAAILDVLADHPELRVAVAQRLAALDGGGTAEYTAAGREPFPLLSLPPGSVKEGPA